MPGTITLPVHMRVGDGEEFHIGDVTLDVLSDDATAQVREGLAQFLRAAADAYEQAGT
jgi:hypothetical protein